MRIVAPFGAFALFLLLQSFDVFLDRLFARVAGQIFRAFA
jgi:hypothetical protein